MQVGGLIPMPWFSTKIRLVVLVEPEGATHYADSVYIFKVDDVEKWDDLWSLAFQRALKLGRQQQEEYRNPDGDRVRWKLKEVISLDIIRSDSLDGVEVYSEPVGIGTGIVIPFDSTFNPEGSEPIQTGI